jgi:hypothetical protein
MVLGGLGSDVTIKQVDQMYNKPRVVRSSTQLFIHGCFPERKRRPGEESHVLQNITTLVPTFVRAEEQGGRLVEHKQSRQRRYVLTRRY